MSKPKPSAPRTREEAGPNAFRLHALSIKYWSHRLDHTLTHTQGSSRLIYLVDAAILALLYFAIQTFGPARQIIFLCAFPAFFLAALNLLHARLIYLQHWWYQSIDNKLLDLLGQDNLRSQAGFKFLRSTHGVYQTIHVVIAVFLLGTAVVMLLYGLGHFQEIKLPPRSA